MSGSEADLDHGDDAVETAARDVLVEAAMALAVDGGPVDAARLRDKLAARLTALGDEADAPASFHAAVLRRALSLADAAPSVDGAARGRTGRRRARPPR